MVMYLMATVQIDAVMLISHAFRFREFIKVREYHKPLGFV